jgi:hypothetical protein
VLTIDNRRLCGSRLGGAPQGRGGQGGDGGSIAAGDDDLPAGRQVTLKWISQRLQMGAWTHLNKRLY